MIEWVLIVVTLSLEGKVELMPPLLFDDQGACERYREMVEEDGLSAHIMSGKEFADFDASCFMLEGEVQTDT